MSRFAINVTWDDVPHLTAEAKQKLWDSYPPHVRGARAQGLPMLGSGVIFPVSDDDIKVPAFKVPPYWPRLGAVDFGWDHPFGAVELAYDTESDTIYVVWTYRASNETPLMHVAALRPRGDWIPWAWPRDGLNETSAGAGIALSKQYGDHGLNMLGLHAQYPSGSVSVEAGLMDMLDRMQTGRFKVFEHLNDWFEEKRRYHRKDGKVVKKLDDLMSASRYGTMMIRHASLSPKLREQIRRENEGAGSGPHGRDPLADYD